MSHFLLIHFLSLRQASVSIDICKVIQKTTRLLRSTAEIIHPLLILNQGHAKVTNVSFGEVQVQVSSRDTANNNSNNIKPSLVECESSTRLESG